MIVFDIRHALFVDLCAIHHLDLAVSEAADHLLEAGHAASVSDRCEAAVALAGLRCALVAFVFAFAGKQRKLLLGIYSQV